MAKRKTNVARAAHIHVKASEKPRQAAGGVTTMKRDDDVFTRKYLKEHRKRKQQISPILLVKGRHLPLSILEYA